MLQVASREFSLSTSGLPDNDIMLGGGVDDMRVFTMRMHKYRALPFLLGERESGAVTLTRDGADPFLSLSNITLRQYPRLLRLSRLSGWSVALSLKNRNQATSLLQVIDSVAMPTYLPV